MNAENPHALHACHRVSDQGAWGFVDPGDRPCPPFWPSAYRMLQHDKRSPGLYYRVRQIRPVTSTNTTRRTVMSRKVIDMVGVARLLGVAEVTPPQWRQRSQKGELWPPLPDTDFPEITDKPLWYEDTIVDWAQRSDRWPPGKAARTASRGPRRSHRTTREELIVADQQAA